MNKISIVNIIEDMRPGGAQKLLIDYLRFFKNHPEIDYKLVVLREKTDSQYESVIESEGLNVDYLNRPKSKFKNKILCKVIDLIDGNIQIIYSIKKRLS